VSDHIEIEQKFDVDKSFGRPDFGSLPGDITAAPPVTFQLSATYFDTADERLAASKITLRRRTGGTDEGWHLKLPAGEGARRELQEPLSAGEEAVDGTGPHQVPGRFAALVAEVTGGLPLAPVAALHTERTVVTLTGHDGRVVAEIADDAVTARRLAGTGGGADAASEPLRWREIEVEVPVAAPALQRAAADLLLSAGARPAGHGSKLARVLGRLARPPAAGPREIARNAAGYESA
jgi:inorganic triphosphatase YgiF